MSSIDILNSMSISEPALIHTYKASRDAYKMNNHGRRHYGLIYTVKGTEIYSFSSGNIRAVPDSVLIIPKEEKYIIDLDGEESIAITFDFEVTDTLSFKPFCIKLNKSNPCRAAFADAEKEWLKKAPEYKAVCKSFFYKIISHLIRQESNYLDSQSYKKIAPAVDYLHTHYLDAGFKLEDAVSEAGISTRYFESLFFAHFKMSPREYLNQLKLDLAKELLLNEKNTVTDVAAKLGYCDIYHFSKFFKLKTGQSPSEFKKM